MKSIYLRNFFATAVMVLVCFLILAFSFVSIGRNYVISEYREDMVNGAREVSRMASAIVRHEALDSMTLGMSLSTVSNSTGNQVFVTDVDGRVVNCSDRAPVCRHLGIVISGEILAQIKDGGEFNQITDLSGMYESKRYVVAMPIYADKSILAGYVFVTNILDNMLGAWSTFLSIGLFVTIAVFAAALIISLIYSKSMARPLDEMASASRKFARGDFSVRVKQEDDTTYEMGALIESFNKMADSLEQAEERRSEFIANISHELRTPMTTIAGFADGILDGTISRDEQDKYLVSIRDETRRLSRLVREMLDVSQTRARAADPEKRIAFDLTELVLQTMLSFESRATSKELDVDPQLPDNHIMVVADKDAITQVIYNLLDNAVKFAHNGTCITVRLYKDNDKAYISIKDEGETIPPDDLPFIFDRFHKSDRSRSLDKTGVGLGLYLVKTIINSHDEDIAVKSENGITEFVFTLALAK
ncbi:MAG: HAMP domain-containing sensor histidine kinase [Eubacteriales bacterium]|nr:HAMP domain-containing sensor histidine kinase [Eubacteriales bacterium]